MVAVVAARRFCAVAVFRGFCGKKGRDEGASCICGGCRVTGEGPLVAAVYDGVGDEAHNLL